MRGKGRRQEGQWCVLEPEARMVEHEEERQNQKEGLVRRHINSVF